MVCDGRFRGVSAVDDLRWLMTVMVTLKVRTGCRSTRFRDTDAPSCHATRLCDVTQVQSNPYENHRVALSGEGYQEDAHTNMPCHAPLW